MVETKVKKPGKAMYAVMINDGNKEKEIMRFSDWESANSYTESFDRELTYEFDYYVKLVE